MRQDENDGFRWRQSRHCEERSDEAIQAGLLRFIPNDGGGGAYQLETITLYDE
jgi:hypothetical protein